MDKMTDSKAADVLRWLDAQACDPDANERFRELRDYIARLREPVVVETFNAAGEVVSWRVTPEGLRWDTRPPAPNLQGATEAQVGWDVAMEAWHSAVDNAAELRANAPDERYAKQAASVESWIKANRPAPPSAPVEAAEARGVADGELIEVNGSGSPVDMFLIEAMVHEDQNGLDKFLPDLKCGDRSVSAILTINGRKAPFVEVLRGFFARMEQDFDTRVTEEAKNIVSVAGLSKIEDALREAEWKIEQAIDAALTAPRPSAPAEMEFDGTDREVLREFIRLCREVKPVGQWPGERVCAAIERVMANERPFRFIAEADMAPEREPSMKDADRALSGPRRTPAQQPEARGVADASSRIVSDQLLHWGGVPVHVTGTVTTALGNWPLIDAWLTETRNVR